MNRLFFVLVGFLVFCGQCPVFAQSKGYFPVALQDSSNRIYYVNVYEEEYVGMVTSKGTPVHATRCTQVTDLRTNITTTDFTAVQQEDVARYFHKNPPAPSESAHCGAASVKFDCFAYALGITDCRVDSTGVYAMVADGDLPKVEKIEDAAIAIHLNGLNYSHASRISRAGLPPIACSGVMKSGGSAAGEKATEPIVIYNYMGKYGLYCIHNTGKSDVDDVYHTSGIRYCVKK